MLTQSPGEGAAQARKEPLQDDASLHSPPAQDAAPDGAPAADHEPTVEAAAPSAVGEDVPTVEDATPHAAIIPFPLAKASEPPAKAAPSAAPPAAPTAEPVVASPPDLAQPMRAGDRLAHARVRAGLTLEAASEKLRIRRDYLAALEDMNLKLLPGKAYAIPYLRSYARLLQLDAEAIVSQFQAESALSREDVTPQIRNPESKPQRERPWIWAVALVLVAAGFVAYRAIAPSADGQPQAGGATLPATAGADKAAPRPVAPSVQGDGLPFGVAAQRLELRATTPAWLEVRTPNGTVMFSQDLGAGQVYQPDTGAGWTLHARDGGAFEVFVNGASVGLLGEAGAPVLGRPVDAIAAAAMPPEPVASAAPIALPPASAQPSVVAPPATGPANTSVYAPVYAPNGAAASRPLAIPSAPGLAPGIAPPSVGGAQVSPPRPARPVQQRVQTRSQTQQKTAAGEGASSTRAADSWETGETPASSAPPPAAPAPSATPAPAPAPSPAPAAEPPPG